MARNRDGKFAFGVRDAENGLDECRSLMWMGVKQVKELVILAVNAETSPDVKDYRSDEVPVFSRAFSSLVDIPINRYSSDSLLLLRFAVEMWRNNLLALPAEIETVLARDAGIYFIEASFSKVEDAEQQ